MANLRCPMCGKPNSEDAEVCQFCAARLKPLNLNKAGAKTPDSKPASPESDLPDWLRSLRDDEGLSPNASPTDNVIQENSKDEVPDWLSRLREQAPSPPEESKPSGLAEDDHGGLAGWLSDPAKPAEAAIPDLPVESEPDWLKSLRDGTGEQSTAQSSQSIPSPEPDDEEIPDWLKNLSGTSEPEIPALAQRPNPATTPSLVENPPTPPVSPSFLSGAETVPSTEEPANVFSPEGEEIWQSNLPDWLAGLEPESSQPETAEPGAAPVSAQISPPAMPLAAQEPTIKPSEPFLASAESVETEAVKASEAEFPDWLANLASGTETTAAAPSAAFSGSQAPEESVAQKTASKETTADDSQQPPVPAPASAEGEDNTPSWLRHLQSQDYSEPEKITSTPALIFDESQAEIQQPPAESSEPFAMEDMPQWLARMSPPSAELAASDSAQKPPPVRPRDEEEITLAPAELPTWVQAMRPIESATPATPSQVESDSQVEETGPLAGLRGVLPAETLPAGIRKPPVYSIKLQVKEKQRADAALLENMMANEAEPLSYTPAKPFPSQRVLRLVIALALIAVALAALLTQPAQMALPGYVSLGVAQMQTGIDKLPPGAPVLLAIEYEPAFAGEMESAATGVVRHLMVKQAKLVMVSTNPTGQLLGDQLVANASYNLNPAYSVTIDNVINLGYLPGGPGGLLSFALSPQGTAPYKTDNSPAWQNGFLKSVNGVQDFAAVIVITENLETARSWIEQVGPGLGHVPLNMVTSAQIGPIISAYAETGQIQGWVSGLAGGAAYEQNTGDSINAQVKWDAYQFGLLIAVILIIVGGLINYGSSLMNRQKTKKEVSS